MFRSLTILRELVQSLAKVTHLLKHSVKLRRRISCGDVAAFREMVCVCGVCCADSAESIQQTPHTPFQDMLPHLHTLYDDVISLTVSTEV